MQDPNNDPRTLKAPYMTQNADGSWKVAFNNNKSFQYKLVELAARMKLDMAY